MRSCRIHDRVVQAVLQKTSSLEAKKARIEEQKVIDAEKRLRAAALLKQKGKQSDENTDPSTSSAA